MHKEILLRKLRLGTTTAVTCLARRYNDRSASQKPALHHPFHLHLDSLEMASCCRRLHKRFAPPTLTPTVCRAPGSSVSRESGRQGIDSVALRCHPRIVCSTTPPRRRPQRQRHPILHCYAQSWLPSRRGSLANDQDGPTRCSSIAPRLSPARPCCVGVVCV